MAWITRIKISGDEETKKVREAGLRRNGRTSTEPVDTRIAGNSRHTLRWKARGPDRPELDGQRQPGAWLNGKTSTGKKVTKKVLIIIRAEFLGQDNTKLPTITHARTK
ncbi:hypothetical protein E2C01_006241 [Portunus trituberculatus]|uniref:Uncharacterized protein n=1 Tax=Portunus trituberculatus TaxID=210409 RepID=A0A5B7D192_PORTR|nr:hypothetical protein [Portunus trituberculatus]